MHLVARKGDGYQKHTKSALKTLTNCLLRNYIFVYVLCFNKKFKICNRKLMLGFAKAILKETIEAWTQGKQVEVMKQEVWGSPQRLEDNTATPGETEIE